MATGLVHLDTANFDDFLKVILLGDSGVGKSLFMETLFESPSPLGTKTLSFKS
jgi:GTP-binding protein EngB required for normal cell division